jgi:hypothetical protein
MRDLSMEGNAMVEGIYLMVLIALVIGVLFLALT